MSGEPRMSQICMDDTIPVYLKRDTRPEASIPYAEYDSIRKLARAVVGCRPMLFEVAAYVSGRGYEEGYARESLQHVRAKLLLMGGSVATRQETQDVVNALNAVTKDYHRDASPPEESGRPKPEVANGFSTAIAEAITRELLLSSGRRESNIVRDARVKIGGDCGYSGRNIDFVWFLKHRKVADIYECKKNPGGLLYDYFTRGWSGHDQDWKKSKFYKMDQLYRSLTGADWDVLLGCVTLDTGQYVTSKLAQYSDLAPPPSHLEIYPVESFGVSFPRAIPRALTSDNGDAGTVGPLFHA